MNRELLAQADPHIREMYDLVWERNKILDRSLQIAADLVAAALRGEEVSTPGKPEDDAPTKDWVDWFIFRGVTHLREQEVIA